ncbi:ABC-type thiamine transport system substrate-binding protein [Bradyrhizobium elkanii]
MDRRTFTTLALASVAALALVPAAQAQEFGSAELIAAAKSEGKLVFYTANFAEIEQQVIKAFNKRFPEIKVEMVRAPGGQLITRVKTEAAAGKLIADVVDHSDRALMQPLEDLFQDYAPPNAADYDPHALISPKYWPRATIAWSIAYNTELVKDPPKSWMDLTKPQYDKLIGQVFAQSGGTTWTRIMFERQVLRRGLLGQAGGDPSGAVSLRRADGRCAGARRDRDRAAALQRDLPKEEGRRADRDLLSA